METTTLEELLQGPMVPKPVWAIAETYDLPTRFAKIVVTNESGQYLLPELPAANYKIWVRGYGLIDSEKKDVKPGSNIDLTAVIAPSEKEAAQYYPGGYWFSLLNVPDKSKFPGTGPAGWFDTKKYLETGVEKAAQGWTPIFLDFNGNGKRDVYTEPGAPDDPKKDKRITKGLYACSPAPDGSVWGSSLGYPFKSWNKS